jgi:hypothetical protein
MRGQGVKPAFELAAADARPTVWADHPQQRHPPIGLDARRFVFICAQVGAYLGC